MRYRPSVSLDQAGYLPIPIEKGERGQKINREGKKEDPGVVEGTCSLTSSHPPPLFSLRSPLRSTRLEKATSCFVSAHKKTQKKVNIQLSNLVPRSHSLLPWPWEIWVRNYQLS